MAGFFEIQLGVLASFCGIAMIFERYSLKTGSENRTAGRNDEDEIHLGGLSKASDSLAMRYLGIYAIVMGSDWLQGPYVYSLYREQYRFTERQVAILFVTGFIAAGTSGPFVGVWADQHGRKKLCRIFCLTYAGSCLVIQQPFFPLLLVGRLLGGISTAILFSVFESWLVAAYQGLPAALAFSSTAPGVKDAISKALSRTMGHASLVNGIVAAVAGIVANWIVEQTSGFRGPFMLSGALLVLTFFIIGTQWDENYGTGASSGTVAVAGGELTKLKQAIGLVRREPAYLVLGFTQTCFEGSMYLFVFLWVPSLQEAGGTSLPLGYIFSAFMISMMLGSIVYTTIVATATVPETTALPANGHTNGHSNHRNPVHDTLVVLHAKLAALICGFAALLFAYSASGETLSIERRFWAFCAFEACVGMYYPVMGMLRGSLVPNEVRATLSSLFRVPLNIFVTCALLTGVSSARHMVFAGCSMLLAVASLACAFVLIKRSEEFVTPQAGENGERTPNYTD
ncbi:hypothetical protein FRC15_009859 [Serendipita sp. 397]|nr:hypothetical protein FRC15_009859 [Serendipita sp. 397]